MKKRAGLLASVLLAFGILTACQNEKDAGKADLDQPKIAGDVVPKDFEAISPDKVTVFLNIQSHPSVVRVCLDGLAFRTVSDHHSGLATPAVDRVPEWDSICQEAIK